MFFDITHSANIINYMLLERIIIKCVHCKIAAQYIFFDCTEIITY